MVEDHVDLQGRVVLVTGGNAGIGKEAAVDLARMGATVAITSRNALRGSDARAEIARRAGRDDVQVVELDLSSFESIHAAADDVLDRFDRLDVLVNNAGAVLSDRRETAEGFEETFGANHLGHFLLTTLLWDRLVATAPARVVNVASLAHRMAPGGLTWSDIAERTAGYEQQSVYSESKLANVLFTMELAERLAGTGVTANCCHPGLVRTGFGSAEDTHGWYRAMITLGRPFMVTASRGADPIVHLASSPELEGVTGEYFSGGYLPVHRSRPSKHGRDPAAARRLWELSEQLVAQGEARR